MILKMDKNLSSSREKWVDGDGAFFSHDINTYKGCSGAIVFLLDKEQPETSVTSNDHGKAIAVHGGGNVMSQRNYGYTLYMDYYKRQG
jgi:hypothetical protein